MPPPLYTLTPPACLRCPCSPAYCPPRRMGTWATERHERLIHRLAEGRSDGCVREEHFIKACPPPHAPP